MCEFRTRFGHGDGRNVRNGGHGDTDAGEARAVLGDDGEDTLM